MTTETLLQQGIAAARAGRREEAHALLMQVVQADERSEQGWLWLAGVIDDPDDMRTCLENVLDLNPGNVKAQQGLAWIESRHGPRAAPTPAPLPAAAPVEPQEPAPYTGPTTRLVPEVAAAADPSTAAPPAAAKPEPPQPAPQKHLLLAEAAAPPDNPCPYCGAPTTLKRNSCIQCRNSLMIRVAPREKRSIPLTILAVLWGISAGLFILSGLATIVAGIVGAQGFQGRVPAGGPSRGSLLLTAIIPGIILLLFGALLVALTRGLRRQARWAYIVNIIFTVLGTIGAIIDVVGGGALMASLVKAPAGRLTPDQARIASSIGAVLGVVIICTIIWQVLFVVLTILSHRDFYGPIMRFQPEVGVADDMGHYNSGVAYKNRGMWYMATKEWEAAVAKSPRDLNYLHALGLAYAQIKLFAKARTTLDTALSIAPDDPRLKESRTLVEQLGARQR